MLLLTYLHLAARRKEVFDLIWEDIDFGNSQIRIWTKKRKDRTKEFDWLPMTSELKKALMGWWQERPVKDTPSVFVCLNKENFCEAYFGKPYKNRQHFMKKICKRSGVKPFGFHGIRHLTASILYHKGYDLFIGLLKSHKVQENKKKLYSHKALKLLIWPVYCIFINGFIFMDN